MVHQSGGPRARKALLVRWRGFGAPDPRFRVPSSGIAADPRLGLHRPVRWRPWDPRSCGVGPCRSIARRRCSTSACIEVGVEGADRRQHVRLRDNGVARVWAPADRCGTMTEVERARFLLRRLYPELEGPRLDAIIDRLDGEWRAGTWTGFRRPTRHPATPTSDRSPALSRRGPPPPRRRCRGVVRRGRRTARASGPP